MMKIAITSNDGEHVNASYEKAETVYIYLVNGNRTEFLEKRRTDFFHGKESKRMFKGHNFERVYEAIKDCDMLCTNKISETPAQRFHLLGIYVEQSEGRITDILNNISVSAENKSVLNRKQSTAKQSTYSGS